MTEFKPERKKLIYVAGKYTEPDAFTTQQNIYKAFLMHHAVLEAGFASFSPHMNHANMDCDKVGYDEIMNNCIEIMRRCDAVLFLDNWEQSKGAKIEKELAEEYEIPIYFSLEELKEQEL